MFNFDLPKDKSSIIKVIGVGGGGGNAVSYMYDQGIRGVDFVICNTDVQAMDLCTVPNKLQLGPELTEGRGSGADPEVGEQATRESIEEVKELLSHNTKMVIAEAAQEMGILTVGIVTYPFSFEGPQRQKQAESGIEELKQHADTLLVIENDKLREIYGNLTYSNAFAKADNILATAAKGIAEIITVPGYVNVDFEDVHTVMKESGAAVMGTGRAEGDDRARKAVEKALTSPLLSENNIEGAEYILLNISYDEKEALMDEIEEITTYIREEAGQKTEIIMGICQQEVLEDQLSITVIATGFDPRQQSRKQQDDRVVFSLDEKEEDQKQNAPQSSKKSEIKDERQFTIEFDIDREKENTNPSSPPETEDNKSKTEQEVREPYLKNKEDTNTSSKRIKQEEENTSEEKSKDEKNVQFTEHSSKSQRLLTHNKKRISQLKNLSVKLNNPSYLNEIEKEPAFKRRNVELENVPHSSEQNLSRYTLSEEKENKKSTKKHNENTAANKEQQNDEKRPQIRKRNPYLHDNVD